MNALAKRDVAIVSEEAGTTRDVIEVHLDLGGLPVVLSDTAGIRAGVGAVEGEGVRRALARAEDADLVLWVVDGTNPIWTPPPTLGAKHCVIARNKSDISPLFRASSEHDVAVPVSAKTGEGLDTLIALLEAVAGREIGATGQAPITRIRHRVELVSARDALKRFVNHDGAPELAAEELRIAARHLGRLTGLIDVEEVLGAIFGEFCIGK
jgi:tRNA modification GTPase